MMYVFDNNFIIDVLANRKGYKEKYFDILIYCIENSMGAICVNQIDALRYIIKKVYPDIYNNYLKLESKLKIIKTPSYVDFKDRLALIDMEDYMIELSARNISAKVITSDKRFLEVSNIAISPNEFYILEENKEKNINFANLKKQYMNYLSEFEKEMDNVLNSASYIMGDAVRELEDNLCKFTGAKHAITCSSGTDALLLAMMAIDIKPGDEVITTPFTFIATAETIALLGAKPIFVDIDENSYNIDVSKIEEKITSKTRAIIAVSLYGQPCDLDELKTVTDNYKLSLIIDGAQSFGATYKGKFEVHFCDIFTTSFFPAKPLGCFGDGGAVLTNNDKLVEKIKSMRIHGQVKRYHHRYIGINGRMDNLQAAILNVKLKHYKKDLYKRQEVAQKYTKLFTNHQSLITPIVKNDRTSAWAQYSIRIMPKNCDNDRNSGQIENARDELQKKLSLSTDAITKIPTAVHYPMPLHLQECFKHLGYKEGDFPVAEKISKEILSLPMNPYLSNEEIGYIVDKIINAINNQ